MKFFYESHSNSPGIYKIINTHSNRIYIGQTNSFKKRWYDHKRYFLNERHQNKFLLNDFNKCRELLGNDDFLEFHIVEVMNESSKEERNIREEYWINQYFDDQNLCYNFKEKPESQERSCFSHTPEETKKILSDNTKKQWESEEHRKNVTEKFIAFWNTKEAKSFASNRANKIWQSEEHKKFMSERLRQRHANYTKEEKEKTVQSLAKGRTKESYENRKKKYRNELSKNRIVIKKEIYIGKLHPSTRTYENCNIMSPDGILYTTITNLREFAIVHKLGIDGTKIKEVIDGTKGSCKGWIKYVPQD